MNLTELNNMLDTVNKLCKEVDKETTELNRAKNRDVDFAYKKFRRECGDMIATMIKAGLEEFAYPTNMKGYAYGTTLWLVLKADNLGGYHSFRETGRIEKWTVGVRNEDSVKAYIVQWYFHELDKEKFELAFKDAIMKAMNDKVNDTIKRNEEAKA